MKSEDIIAAVKKLANKDRAKVSQSFFKTQKGGYGEGDIFLGLPVPDQRKIAKEHKSLALAEVKKLLKSKVHEHRFIALEILIFKYEDKNRSKVVQFYLKNRKYVNNWDLVDTSAPYILGDWLLDNDREVIYNLALSKSLWDKRIAIVSTYAFIRKGQLRDTFRISEILMYDDHDLIHKAVGWMLREAGKKSVKELEKFLKAHFNRMPRTMLRYAIEKFPENVRQAYLKGGYK